MFKNSKQLCYFQHLLLQFARALRIEFGRVPKMKAFHYAVAENSDRVHAMHAWGATLNFIKYVFFGLHFVQSVHFVSLRVHLLLPRTSPFLASCLSLAFNRYLSQIDATNDKITSTFHARQTKKEEKTRYHRAHKLSSYRKYCALSVSEIIIMAVNVIANATRSCIDWK